MALLKGILLVAIFTEISLSAPDDKWNKSKDLPTFFINANQKYNWFEAWNECAMRNMSLVAVDTVEKHNALQKVLRDRFDSSPDLWLGGNDLGEDGKHVWSSTGQQFGFTNWLKGQPDNTNGIEHCVQIWNKSDFEWNDLACYFKIGYICEENHLVLAAREDLARKKHFIDELFEHY